MKVVIAGGGTGGHLFPGIAVAREFLRVNERTRILFIGSRKGVERTIIPREGFDIRYIITSGFKNKPLNERIMAILKIPVSLVQSLCYLIGFRPDLVVGIGGYSSGTVGISSFFLRIPLVIQEQNLYPGITNKILGRIARVIFTSYEETARFFKKEKTICSGNPVRREIVELAQRENNAKSDVFTVFVFGGSQGARSINRAMIEAYERLESHKGKIKILHQTGERDFDEVSESVKARNFPAEVSPFIVDMGAAYEKAQLVISRSGATTLAELTAAGKAAILIPFPHAANNHQEHNAREMEKSGGAIVILETDLLREMMCASRKSGNPHAAEKIVKRCYELTGAGHV